MSDQLLLPVLIAGISTKVDGSIKLVLETRELGSKDAAHLFDLRSREAWAVLSPNKLEDVSVPKESADSSMGSKTPAQRLRNSLYVLWKQSGGQGDFESFYRIQMDKFNEWVKEKLT